MIRMICWRLKLEEFILFSILVSVHPNLHMKSDKLDHKIRFLIICLPNVYTFFLLQNYKKNYCPPKFLKYMYLRWAVIQNFFCCLSKIYKFSYFLTRKSYLLVLRSVSMLWSWLVLSVHPPSLCSLRDENKHPRILPVLGLGSLPLMEKRKNINRYDFSPILNTCISTTLEREDSLSTEVR